MSRFRQGLLSVVLLVLCVGCDQITKHAAHSYISLDPPRSWFHDTVRLEYAENQGAFLSLGGGLSKELRIVLFQVLPALWLVALALHLIFVNVSSMRLTVAWSLVLSGGAGNLIDRIMHDGRVVDFLNLGIGSLRTGIFNVADVCITIGVVLLIVETVWPRQMPMVSDSPR
jgi:signal peptidase II